MIMITQSEKHIIELVNTAIEICNKNTGTLNELTDSFEKRLRLLKQELDNQALQLDMLSKRVNSINEAIDQEILNTAALVSRMDQIEQATREIDSDVDSLKQNYNDFRQHYNLL